MQSLSNFKVGLYWCEFLIMRFMDKNTTSSVSVHWLWAKIWIFGSFVFPHLIVVKVNARFVLRQLITIMIVIKKCRSYLRIGFYWVNKLWGISMRLLTRLYVLEVWNEMFCLEFILKEPKVTIWTYDKNVGLDN